LAVSVIRDESDSRQHGSPAETKPDTAIFTQGVKSATKFQSTAAPNILKDPNLYSQGLSPTVVLNDTC
jgi:hypothetical protein